MTVVVFAHGVMAADKQASYGGSRRVVTKIHRVGPLLVGGSGDMAFVLAMVEWVKVGRDSATFPAAQRDKDDWQPVMVVEPGGQILLYERTPHPIRYEDKVAAIGTGRPYAEAALYLGKSARVAVEVACALNYECGNGVDTLTLED